MKIEEIKVIVINKVALDKALDESVKAELAKCVGSSLAPQLAEGESFRTRTDKWALIEGTNILTTDECVFDIIDNKIKVDIFSETAKKEGESFSTFSVFPRFTVSLSLEELKEYATETIDLVSFMGSRYNYNYRIESNQTKLLYHLKNI